MLLPTGFVLKAAIPPERPRLGHAPTQQRAGLDHERAKSREDAKHEDHEPHATRLRDLRAQRLRDTLCGFASPNLCPGALRSASLNDLGDHVIITTAE